MIDLVTKLEKLHEMRARLQGALHGLIRQYRKRCTVVSLKKVVFPTIRDLNYKYLKMFPNVLYMHVNRRSGHNLIQSRSV